MKSEWLPTMPLHVAIWSQIVMDSDLDWADQGKAMRLLANAWSSGELGRKPWASDAAWQAAGRMWPEIAAARSEAIAKRDKLSESGKRGNAVRWGSPPDRHPIATRLAPRSHTKQNQKQNHNQEQEQKQKQKPVVGRRGSRLPDDTVLTGEWVEIAERHGVRDVDAVFTEFVNYWTSLPGQRATKLDWTKTWENQCIKVGRPSRRERPRTAAAETMSNVEDFLEGSDAAFGG